MQFNSKKYIQGFVFFLLIGATACTKSLNVTPKYVIDIEKAFSNDSMANLQMAGLYSQISNSQEFTTNFSLDLGYVSDELEPLSWNAISGASGYTLYNYKLRSLDATTNTYWSDLYTYIYTVNIDIEGINESTGMSDEKKNQYLGELYTMRAYLYYYLTSFYGAIPYVTTGNYKESLALKQTSTDSILLNGENDIVKAQSLLSNDYPTDGKYRINLQAANAILSRIALSRKDYSLVISSASDVINSNLYSLESLDNMFQSSSNETILQMWSLYDYTYIGNSAVSSSGVYGVTHTNDNNLYDDFSADDKRKNEFIAKLDDGEGDTVYAPYKYKNNGVDMNTDITENTILIKLDEVYLNRAEAYANSNNLSAALADLNKIRTRAGLSAISSIGSSDALLSLIYEERRKELCFEFADRWITLKRTNQANTVLGAFKPTEWTSTAQLFPIPLDDLKKSSLTQNPGY